MCVLVRVRTGRIFSLDHLDDYQKHFTVMNYRSDAPLKLVTVNCFCSIVSVCLVYISYCSSNLLFSSSVHLAVFLGEKVWSRDVKRLSKIRLSN